jgi:hypothetical protein
MFGNRDNKGRLLSNPKIRSIIATVIVSVIFFFLSENFHVHPWLAVVIALITWVILML